MDHHVQRAVTEGLRRRGVDVATAFEDGSSELPDTALLERASELGRVLFTQDDDLLVLATAKQLSFERFAGVVYAHQRVPIGVCIAGLELIAKVLEPQEIEGRVLYLPL